MPQHTVVVDSTISPSRIEYSDVFNVAVPFIDRHLDEVRGGKAAIVFDDTGATVNYMQLAERVNRCGNLLRSLAWESEGRVLMVVKDCPEFFYVFWGAIKAGLVPVPLNTLLRADDYRHIIEDSECAGLVYSPEYREEVARALAGAAHQPTFILCTEGPQLGGRYAGGGIGHPGARPNVSGLGVLLAVFVRLYGAAQGRGAPPPGHRHNVRALRGRHAGRYRGRRVFLRGQAVLRLRAGQHDDVPAVGGRDGGPERAASHAGNDLRYHRAASAYALLWGAHVVRGPIAGTGRVAPRPVIAAGLRIGRGRRCRPIYSAVGRNAPALSSWTESGPRRRCTFSFRTLPRTTIPGAAAGWCLGTRRESWTRRGSRCRQGRRGGCSSAATPRPRTTGTTPNEPPRRWWRRGWLNTGDTYLRDADGYYVYCGRSDDMLKVGGIWCSPVEIEGGSSSTNECWRRQWWGGPTPTS